MWNGKIKTRSLQVKVKVKLFRWLIELHALEICGMVEANGRHERFGGRRHVSAALLTSPTRVRPTR